jgi:hypothetical protein
VVVIPLRDLQIKKAGKKQAKQENHKANTNGDSLLEIV